jgi:hypothetical protein
MHGLRRFISGKAGQVKSPCGWVCTPTGTRTPTRARIRPKSEAWGRAQCIAINLPGQLQQALTVPDWLRATAVSNLRRTGSSQVQTRISKSEGSSGDTSCVHICHHAGPQGGCQMAPAFNSRAVIRTTPPKGSRGPSTRRLEIRCTR